MSKIVVIICVLSALLLVPNLVRADGPSLPEIMKGQTTLVKTDWTGQTYYGGMTGNEVVYNSGITGDEASPFYGFDKTAIDDCVASLPLLSLDKHCFSPNKPGVSSIKMMNSRTAINGTLLTELATLYYSKSFVMGDVYGKLDSSFFSLWGRNLQYGGSSDSTWHLGSDYVANPESQMSMEGADFTNFLSKAKTLAGEGQPTPAVTGDWYLQSSTTLGDGTSIDSKKYPEGKVWSLQSSSTTINYFSISTSFKYKGVGTIIIDGKNGFGGRLFVDQGVSIQPADADSRLGIIVLGTGTTGDDGLCSFSKNVNVNAYVFCQNKIETVPVRNGGTFTGAFVARTFWPATASGYWGGNARFYYRPGSSADMPPGFRYLNLPTSGE